MIGNTFPITITAGVALEPNRLIRRSGATWIYAQRGQIPEAVTAERIANGDIGAAVPLSHDATLLVSASGAVTTGQALYGDANGQVSATAGGVRLGTHLSGTIASGGVAELLFTGAVDAAPVTLTNGSGGSLAAGELLSVQGRFYAALATVANAAAGLFQSFGEVDVPKSTGGGTDYAVGTPLGWDSVGKVVTTDLSNGLAGFVLAQPATTDTRVRLSLHTGRPMASINRVATSGEASANNGTWVIPFTPTSWDAVVLTSAGANEAGMTRTISGATVTFAATDIVANSVIRGWAIR